MTTVDLNTTLGTSLMDKLEFTKPRLSHWGSPPRIKELINLVNFFPFHVLILDFYSESFIWVEWPFGSVALGDSNNLKFNFNFKIKEIIFSIHLLSLWRSILSALTNLLQNRGYEGRIYLKFQISQLLMTSAWFC